METRLLGETDHDSSVLTLGALALDALEQDAADRAVELAVDRGVSHVDVAPTYGDAELKLAPKLNEYRDDLFVGCKTTERTYAAAWDELEASLDRLDVDQIDLYQFHAVTEPDDLTMITGEDGALTAFREAQAEGLIDHIGLTSHGHPDLILDAIDQIDDLATVMFPLNYTVLGQEVGYDRVLERAHDDGLGTIGIKAYAKGPWDDADDATRPYGTWYEPYDTQAQLRECTNFALSQGLTTITNPGDPKLLAGTLEAAANFEPLAEHEQAALIERGEGMETPVPSE
jgi:aryl-alcohol dehydrogenase-like predicted oxidoreductase